jgi:hypothetical protein
MDNHYFEGVKMERSTMFKRGKWKITIFNGQKWKDPPCSKCKKN